jgi:hypothetical protein
MTPKNLALQNRLFNDVFNIVRSNPPVPYTLSPLWSIYHHISSKFVAANVRTPKYFHLHIARGRGGKIFSQSFDDKLTDYTTAAVPSVMSAYEDVNGSRWKLFDVDEIEGRKPGGIQMRHEGFNLRHWRMLCFECDFQIVGVKM